MGDTKYTYAEDSFNCETSDILSAIAFTKVPAPMYPIGLSSSKIGRYNDIINSPEAGELIIPTLYTSSASSIAFLSSSNFSPSRITFPTTGGAGCVNTLESQFAR